MLSQYSPKNAIPYVAMVDAGTVELVRGSGVKVMSSADLVQKYEACWTMNSLSLIDPRARPLTGSYAKLSVCREKCSRKKDDYGV